MKSESCGESNSQTCCPPKSIPTYFIGDDWVILFAIINQLLSTPIDLSAASEIKVIFKNTDGTYYEATLTGTQIALVGGGTSGQFTCTIPGTTTALIAASQAACCAPSDDIATSDIELRYTISGKTQSVPLIGEISLQPRVYPAAT